MAAAIHAALTGGCSDDPARRPSGRGYRAARCEACRAALPFCFCAELRPIACETRVLVVMHALEQHRPTNTGRFAAALLRGARLVIRGARGEELRPRPLDLAVLDEHPEGVLLLHPGPGAALLDARYLKPSGPLTLVVPDGTWTQTRHMLRREPRLRALQRVALPPGAPSRYTLRRRVHEEGVCTLEAIGRALAALESPSLEAELERVLSLVLSATLRARGAR